MNRRGRREGSALSSPVLVGALTVLVTVVAVTLAYNANQGLPFVPRYTVNVQIRDASEVTRNADVRIGGSQVGFVNKVTASHDSSGRPIAVVNMKLQESVKPLPSDSRVIVRLKGAIGLKYIEIDLGHAHTGIPDGGTVPLKQSSSTVDLDQVLSMFTPATRVGVAKSTIGYGVALAGRGTDLNNTIRVFVPLLRDLSPVARNLSSKSTDLGGFFRGLESFSSALVPVAQTQASLYTNLAVTFGSLATVAHPFLQQWISDTPPEFAAVIQNSPTIQAFLLDTAAFFRESLPGAQTIPQSAPVLADAFAIGTRNLPGHRRAGQADGQPLQAHRDLRGDASRAAGSRQGDADIERAQRATPVPHADASDLQLREPAPAQSGQRAVDVDDNRHDVERAPGGDRGRARRRVRPVTEDVRDPGKYR